MPLRGDAFLGRRLCEATPFLGDAPSGHLLTFLPFFGALERSHHVLTLTLTFWSTPQDGTQAPQSLADNLFSAKRLRPRPIVHVAF